MNRQTSQDAPGSKTRCPLRNGPKLEVEIQPWYRSLAQTLREVFLATHRVSPPGTSQLRVADIWERKTYIVQLKRAQLSSLLFHVLLGLLLTVPLLRQPMLSGMDEEGAPGGNETLPAYAITFPVSPRESRGGGGGGDRNPLPPSRGKLPLLSLETPLTPPAIIRNQWPKLAAEPTLLVDPRIRIPAADDSDYGDPLSAALIKSGGPGSGGGFGTKPGGGVGPGEGPGFGPGRGGNCCDGIFKIGAGVSSPVCLYCPDPDYSEEARKAKYQGTVVLWAIVDESGHVRNIEVVQSLGLGLDKEAVRAVQNWIFEPSRKDGEPVPVAINIEVHFRLY